MNFAVVDYETEPIEGRPEYPPKPQGVALWTPKLKPTYIAWGHHTGGNGMYQLDGPDGLSGNVVRVFPHIPQDALEWAAQQELNEIWDYLEWSVVFHNEKFDTDVAETHHHLPMLPYTRRHDTMYQIALDTPHEPNISLKPSAERILGLPPDEQEEVIEWLVAHQPVPGLVLVRSKKPNSDHPEKRYAGAYIVYAPGDLVAKYAIGDVVRTGLIHQKLYQKICEDQNPSGGPTMKDAYERELRLMPYLLQNEREGMQVDVPALTRDIEKYHKIYNAIGDWMSDRLGVERGFNFLAREELAAALQRKGLVSEWTLTKRGKMSTSKKNMTLDKFLDQELALALGYHGRLHTALAQSMEPWLGQAQRNNGRIYTQWNQVRQAHGEETRGTRTFRMSCSRFMNITKDWYDKGDYTYPKFLEAAVPDFADLPLVRRYIVPDEGCVFGHRDYSQQEYRIVAHYEDNQLKKMYLDNPKTDFHIMMRDLIAQIVGQVLERRVVKTLNFGDLYGLGIPNLAKALKCTEQMARQLKAAKAKAVPGIEALSNSIKRRAKNGLPIREWGGGLIYCEPPGFSEKYGRVMSFEYKMFNYLIQRSAASCTKEALIRYHEHPDRKARFLVAVHDEINASMPKDRVKEEMKVLADCMSSVKFDVPMLSDGSYGPTWADQDTECE